MARDCEMAAQGRLEPEKGSIEQFQELEKIGKQCTDLSGWKKEAASLFGLKTEDATWLADKELMSFFQGEAAFKEEDRLSSSKDNGLW